VVICPERGADLHTAQLMPLPLTISCFSEIQIGFAFLVPTHLGSPGQRAVKRARARVCVCVCVCVRVTLCIFYYFMCAFYYVSTHQTDGTKGTSFPVRLSVCTYIGTCGTSHMHTLAEAFVDRTAVDF